MRRLSRAALIACGVLLGAACGLSLSGTGPGDGTPTGDSGPESGTIETGAMDGAGEGSVPDVIAADGGLDASGCPDAIELPQLVNVGDFCIDATEVSVTMFVT